MIRHRPVEQALLRLAGNDDRPGIAAASPSGGGRQVESALHRAGRGVVAVEAVFDEKRPDPTFEELDPGGIHVRSIVVRPRPEEAAAIATAARMR